MQDSCQKTVSTVSCVTSKSKIHGVCAPWLGVPVTSSRWPDFAKRDPKEDLFREAPQSKKWTLFDEWPWLTKRNLAGEFMRIFQVTYRCTLLKHFLRSFLHECHQCVYYTYIVLNPFFLSKAWAHAPIMTLHLLLATCGSWPLKNGWLEYYRCSQK